MAVIGVTRLQFNQKSLDFALLPGKYLPDWSRNTCLCQTGPDAVHLILPVLVEENIVTIGNGHDSLQQINRVISRGLRSSVPYQCANQFSQNEPRSLLNRRP